MDSEAKVSYTPSKTKRFEVSHDPISRERLTALVTTVRELRNNYPFVAGAVLFGSLSKGKRLDEHIAGKSDVDLIIYLDTDELKRNYENFVKDRDQEKFNEFEEIDKELHEYYDPRSEDEKILELTRGYLGDVAEDTFAANLTGKKQPPKSMGFVIKPISITGDYSIYETFRRVFKYHNLDNFASSVSNDLEPLHYSAVALPWGLDVRGGMAKYRKSYLTQLQQLSKQERDLEWRVTMRVIKFYERQGDIPKKIKGQYLNTFDEALRYYGVKSSSIQAPNGRSHVSPNT